MKKIILTALLLMIAGTARADYNPIWPFSRGGTGQSTQQTAMDALAGATTSGSYLRGNGSHVVMSAIQAGDVPTLNQNTSGSAATATTQASSDNSTSIATTAFVKSYCASGPCVRTIGFHAPYPTTGQAGGVVFFPVAGAITGWYIAAPAGTATIQVWKIAAGTAIPTVSNSISSSGVQLATGTAIESTSLGDFTTLTVAAGDMFIFNIGAVSGGPSYLDFQLKILVN